MTPNKAPALDYEMEESMLDGAPDDAIDCHARFGDSLENRAHGFILGWPPYFKKEIFRLS